MIASNGATPVPLSVTSTGVPPPLSEIVAVCVCAVADPVDSGAKVKLLLKDDAELEVIEPLSVDPPNGEDGVVMLSVVALPLVTVATLTLDKVLVVPPTSTSPNDSVDWPVVMDGVANTPRVPSSSASSDVADASDALTRKSYRS